MKDKIFLDTNIFVYNFDTQNREKCSESRKLVSMALERDNFVISYQVIQEFSHVALKKFQIPLKRKDLEIYLKSVMFPLCSIYYSNENILKALELQERYKLSLYDSILLGSALKANCKTFLSEDLQDGLVIKGMRIMNPFRKREARL